jgi:hypothetical protein
MVVAEASSWVFAGANLHDGDRLPGVVGPEYDHYNPGAPGPPNVEILAHSPVRCHGRPSFSDMTYYVASSNAGVFDAGTNWWISKLAGGCDSKCESTVTTITDNVLDAFGAGPAGRTHLSASNYPLLSHVPLVPADSESQRPVSGPRPPPTFRSTTRTPTSVTATTTPVPTTRLLTTSTTAGPR